MLNYFSKSNPRSSKWNNIRKEYLLKHNSCSGCGKKDNLEVHHIEPFHVSPEKELDVSNLITFCKNCHFTIGHLMDWESWNINAKNDALVYLDKVKNRPYYIKVQSNEKIINLYNCFFNMVCELLRWNKRS